MVSPNELEDITSMIESIKLRVDPEAAEIIERNENIARLREFLLTTDLVRINQPGPLERSARIKDILPLRPPFAWSYSGESEGSPCSLMLTTPSEISERSPPKFGASKDPKTLGGVTEDFKAHPTNGKPIASKYLEIEGGESVAAECESKPMAQNSTVTVFINGVPRNIPSSIKESDFSNKPPIPTGSGNAIPPTMPAALTSKHTGWEGNRKSRSALMGGLSTSEVPMVQRDEGMRSPARLMGQGLAFPPGRPRAQKLAPRPPFRTNSGFIPRGPRRDRKKPVYDHLDKMTSFPIDRQLELIDTLTALAKSASKGSGESKTMAKHHWK
ncbi:hypothetical protein TWF730_000982 [Orbilia blumenaviensis]|uniref:Uncharacterized protein n=1 Tax=Orbilia blumenaviensis TaxID=1796055 RepID=A0AAV9VN81_9PEZI